MAKIAGISLPIGGFGYPVRDGALCITENQERPIVLVEERFSGKRHDGGYSQALNYAKSMNLLSGLELVVVSSCCEPELQGKGLETISKQFTCDAISVSHHLSHAHQVFENSQFNHALIIVSDAGGNLLESFDEREKDWWKYKREQLSIFSATRTNIELIERQFDNPYSIGLGEFWRYMTLLCGFKDSIHASKVMELAGFGEPIPGSYFFELNEFTNNIIHPNIENDPFNKKFELGQIILKECTGLDPNMDNFNDRANVAAWAQKNLEHAFEIILGRLSKETKIPKLCIAGGVALNCRLIHSIRKLNLFDDVFSGYAPSDCGQAIGNALYGIRKSGSKHPIKDIHSPFLGPDRVCSIEKLGEMVSDENYIFSSGFCPSTILQILDSGFIVATCIGKSEVGERALGNTSLLSMPADKKIVNRLNEIKNRSPYTPIAAAVDAKTFSHLFGQPFKNHQYMAEIVIPKESEVNRLKDIVHTDKSIRIQLVGDDTECYLSKLVDANNKSEIIKDFIVLNTSFNKAGHPMPQTVEQAITQFKELSIACLLINEDTLIRRKSSALESVIEKSLSDRTDFFDVSEIFINKEYIVKTFGNIVFRNNFALYEEYLESVKFGRKITTIRYDPKGISMPASSKMSLKITKVLSQKSYNDNDYEVFVHGVKIKKFFELDDIDAQRDGFKNANKLREKLIEIYPSIKDESFVTINFIELEHFPLQ